MTLFIFLYKIEDKTVNNLLGIKKFTNQLKKSDQSRFFDYWNKNNQKLNSKTESILGKVLMRSELLPATNQVDNTGIPFTDESSRYFLIFDGKIFNHQELKNNLLELGTITFRTSTDLEVLFYHLIENGVQGINDLEGDFAFAFYDAYEDELILARDHLGVKPLLFSIQEDEILFASELTPFKYWLPSWGIDPKALNAFFRLTYIPAPDTIIRGVHKLLPGHFLTVKGNTLDIQCYSSHEKKEKLLDISYEEAVDQTRKNVEESVIKRLYATTEIGSFLSGGVDSSIVAKVASDFQNDLKTFSIGYKNQAFFDESKYAQNVAQHIDSNHTPIQLGEEEIIPDFNKMLACFDEPYADSSVIAVYFLMREAKKEVDICLSGDGADEILAGYYKHKAFLRSKKPGIALRIASKIAALLPGGNRKGKIANRIRQLKKFNTLLQKKWPDSYWFLAEFISQKQGKDLLRDYSYFNYKLAYSDDNLQSFLQNDQDFVLPYDMLKKVDVMSRFYGLEVRAPFLDKSFVEFANSLPEQFKLKGNVGKRILRDAFRGQLPDEVFSRSKRGFEVPLHAWIKASWNEVVQEEWLDKSFLEEQGIFKYEGVQALKKNFEAANEEEATVTMWAYIVFQNWYQRWTKK